MTNQREKRNEASLPHSVFSAEWLRKVEGQAAQETGISLFTLMQRAAEAAGMGGDFVVDGVQPGGGKGEGAGGYAADYEGSRRCLL